MNNYLTFKKVADEKNVDIELFCMVSGIEEKVIKDAEISNKLPNYVAMSLMHYIDNIDTFQDEYVEIKKTLFKKALDAGFEIKNGKVVINPFEIPDNEFSLEFNEIEKKYIVFQDEVI